MNKKEKIKKVIATVITLLFIGILAIVGEDTFAKYITKIDGTGTAEIARWSFKANGQTKTIENIKLNNTYNVNKLEENKIAPATSGSFDIVLDVNGSDVAVDYNITFDNLKNKPTNLKFTYDGITKNSLKELEELLKGRILLTDNRTKTITIYWSWDYQTGDNENEILENDRIDTNDAGKDFTFDVTVTGTQVNPSESD